MGRRQTPVGKARSESTCFSPEQKRKRLTRRAMRKVDDLEQEIQGKKVIIVPNSPSPGVTVAFIEHNGAPVEFLQIDKTQAEDA